MYTIVISKDSTGAGVIRFYPEYSMKDYWQQYYKDGPLGSNTIMIAHKTFSLGSLQFAEYYPKIIKILKNRAKAMLYIKYFLFSI
jgi:hypothetical protein